MNLKKLLTKIVDTVDKLVEKFGNEEKNSIFFKIYLWKRFMKNKNILMYIRYPYTALIIAVMWIATLVIVAAEDGK